MHETHWYAEKSKNLTTVHAQYMNSSLCLQLRVQKKKRKKKKKENVEEENADAGFSWIQMST